MTESDCLLIVEDDEALRAQLRWCFDGQEVVFAANRTEAIAALRRSGAQVVLQDLGLPPDAEGTSEGFATLREILRLAPATKVIVVTGNSDRDSSLRAIAEGASDFFAKPVDVDVLRLMVGRAFHVARLERELAQLRAAGSSEPLAGIVATDPKMIAVCRRIEKVAPANVSVLILGESGTGKELLSRAIHLLSPRRDKRFQAINCAAIPEQLLEAELFGHEKGAFTGAVKQTLGKVEMANGGTLFLDEIGDMPLPLQSKLLRFLQDRVIERVGGREPIQTDVRIVAATNQDLESLIHAQKFRQDLYYRISEVTVEVPPLRERRGDIVALARSFLFKYMAGSPRPKRGFTEDAIRALTAHPWVGNVRELENKVKAATLLADEPLITAADLGLRPSDDAGFPLSLKEVRNRAEREAVQRAIATSCGNLSKAAELLGVSRPTLYDLIERHGLDTAASRAESEP
jgi:two-component system, NtrC family, response regulator